MKSENLGWLQLATAQFDRAPKYKNLKKARKLQTIQNWAAEKDLYILLSPTKFYGVSSCNQP